MHEKLKPDYFTIYPKLRDQPLLSTSHGCHEECGPTIARSSNFSRKVKQSKFLCKISQFLILASHLKLFEIWSGKYDIGFHMCNLWPSMKSTFLCIQPTPFQTSTCLPIFSTLFLPTLGNHFQFPSCFDKNSCFYSARPLHLLFLHSSIGEILSYVNISSHFLPVSYRHFSSIGRQTLSSRV